MVCACLGRRPSLVFIFCALCMLPRVHPDRIALQERFPALGQLSWICPVVCKPQRHAAAPQTCKHSCVKAVTSLKVVASAVPGADERTKTLDWVNAKTKGRAADFDGIFERSKKRLDTYLGSGVQEQGLDQDESIKMAEKTMSWVNVKTKGGASEFDIIFERSSKRIDSYLNNARKPEERANDHLNKSADLAIVECSKKNTDAHLARENERGKPSAAQVLEEPKTHLRKYVLTETETEPPTRLKSDFDVIVERSRKRIDMEAQRSELRSKREEIARLQKSMKARQQQVQAYRKEVEDIESSLTVAQRLGAARSRIQDLQDQLRASQISLRGTERNVKLVEEQAATFLTSLRDTEAQLEALRIRNELVSERERQLAKLQNLVLHIHEDEQGASVSAALLLSAVGGGGQTGAAHIDRAQVVVLQEDRAEQEHNQLRDFLWQLVGLKKNKAAIAAAGMPVLPEGVSLESMAATVAWLQEHVLTSSERLTSTVEQCPAILLLDVRTKLAPVLAFLSDTLALDRRGVSTVISAHPALLEANVTHDLAPRLELLREATGVAKLKLGKLVQMHPSVLGKGGLQCLQAHIDFFVKEVGMSKVSMGKILGALPGLTCMSVDMQLRPTHMWLLKIGVPPARVERMLVQHPKTLGYSLDKNLKPTVAYLWDDIGVRDDKIGRIVSAFPQILGLSVDSNLKPTVAFLVDEVGVPREKLAKIFSTFPQLFGLSLDKTIRPRVHFLANEVGVPTDKMAKVIFSFPNLLAYNHLDNLRPTVSYLHDDVGIPTERMGKLVATHPQILGYSVEDKLLPTVQYLVEEVGVPEERIGSVVERCPKLLGCSVDRNLRPTVKFLRDEVGMSEAEVGQMVLRYPSLLGLSIDNNLRPKLHYLVDEVKIDQNVIRRQLTTCPQLLAYSLEQRIKPRHRLLHSYGLKLGLHSMLSPTDLAFYQRYGGGLARVAPLNFNKYERMNSEREREADDCDESELELRLPDVKTTAGGGSAPPVYYWHKGQEEAAAQPKRRSRSLLPVSAASSKAISKALPLKERKAQKTVPRPQRKAKGKAPVEEVLEASL